MGTTTTESIFHMGLTRWQIGNCEIDSPDQKTYDRCPRSKGCSARRSLEDCAIYRSRRMRSEDEGGAAAGDVDADRWTVWIHLLIWLNATFGCFEAFNVRNDKNIPDLYERRWCSGGGLVGEEGGVGGCRGERGNAVVSDEVEGVELESVEAWAKAVSDSHEHEEATLAVARAEEAKDNGQELGKEVGGVILLRGGVVLKWSECRGSWPRANDGSGEKEGNTSSGAGVF
uniref:Uncharacterized protein K0031E03.13 n=1 Tax=Oryza sativa subsp. indica TaxID=39946 RepID=C8TEW4_ORYSI|nr:hypothetical protein [Oryza sativa Indica Group]